MKPKPAPKLIGVRSTTQRRLILKAISKQEKPVSAQTLHAKMRASGGSIGLATIYRTLQALAESGILRTFPTASGEQAYKVCEPGHHHHLMCTQCGRVEEIPSCDVQRWASAVGRRHGFKVSSHQADIFGLCPKCS